MFGFNPIASAPIAATDKVNYLFTAVYNGTAADVPTLSAFEDETFSAPNVFTGTVRVGTGVLAQTHTLTSSDIATDASSVDSATLTQVHVLTAPDVATGNVDITTLSAFEDETFSAPDIDAGAPVIDTSAITQVHSVSASLAFGNVIVGVADVTINHVFSSPPEFITGPVEIGQTRFPFMEVYIPAEIWTEQTDTPSETWTEQTDTPSTTWTEAA